MNDPEWRKEVEERTEERVAALREFVSYVSVGRGIRLPVLRAAGVAPGAAATLPAQLAPTVVAHMDALEREAAVWRRKGEGTGFHPTPTRLGALVHAIAARQAEDDVDIFALLVYFAEANPSERSAYRSAIWALEPRPDQIHSLTLAGRWYGEGLPTLRLGADVASALVFTDLPREFVEDLTPPFPTFRIELPPALVPDVGTPGAEWSHILVCRRVFLGRTLWSYWVESNSGEAFGVHQFALADLAEAWAPEHEEKWGDAAKRVIDLAGRLVIGVCALLAGEPDALRRLSTKKAEKWSLSRAPQLAAYTVGADVKVGTSLVDAVRDYVLGVSRVRRALAWPVRGHWRSQPHGPERSLRRRQWIQPFWKGDLSAVLGLRSDARSHPARREDAGKG